MLTKVVVVALMVAAALATEEGGERERRRFFCPGRSQLASNPCLGGSDVTSHPMPQDNTRFIICDLVRCPHVTRCHAGTYYNQEARSCLTPFQTPAVSSRDVHCTVQDIFFGNNYFPDLTNNSRFYECTGVHQAQLMDCPRGLVWSDSLRQCTYPTLATGPAANFIGNQDVLKRCPWGLVWDYALRQCAYPSVDTTPAANSIHINENQLIPSPCSAQQQTSDNPVFLRHPDPTKFFQCHFGQLVVMQCPSGLVWYQDALSCASHLTSVAGQMTSLPHFLRG